MINPILERELITKVRSWKAPLTIFIYLSAIGLVSYIGIRSMMVNSSRFGIDPRTSAVIFDSIVIIQLLILMFVVPMFTATSISGERERQTLDLMLCADISPWRIIFGKISASLLYIMFLVILAIPFLSTIFLLDGMTPLDLVKIILYYAATAFTIGCIGLYCSTRYRKNLTSIVMTYVILAVLYILPFLLFIIITINFYDVMDMLMSENYYAVLAGFFGANPGFGLLSLLSNDLTGIVNESAYQHSFLSGVPTWLISIAFYSMLSLITLALSYRHLSKRQ